MSNPFDKLPGMGPRTLSDLFAPTPIPNYRPSLSGMAPSPPNPFSSLFTTPPRPAPRTLLGDVLDEFRRRNDWNDRFEHWEKPASVSEEGTIERAHSNVASAIVKNRWLSGQLVVIERQGSYHNNTNVRTEADIDLRAVHPAIFIEYAPEVHQPSATTVLGYGGYGLTYQQIFDGLRSELTSSLIDRFGRANVDTSGKKAIRVKGITGSRAEVDVVPTVRFHHVRWLEYVRRYDTIEGVAILSTDGRWTINFPEQHVVNGVAKRARTANRFKRIVRIFKRLRADMIDRGLIKSSVPSFLVECLVYLVEDEHFLVDTDDRYGRVRRVALRMREILSNPLFVARLVEINGVKPLFGSHQGWTHDDALRFVNAAIAHLGDA